MNVETPRYRFAPLHLFKLVAIAVVQPLLDVLGRHSIFFIARYAKKVDIILMVGILSIVVPLLLVTIEWILGRWRRPWRDRFHLGLIGGLVFLISLPLLQCFATFLRLLTNGRSDPMNHEGIAVIVVGGLGAVVSTLLYA